MASFRIQSLALSWCVGVILAVIAFLIGYQLREVFDGTVYSISRVSSGQAYTWIDSPWRFVIEVGFQTMLCGFFAVISLFCFALGLAGFTEKDVSNDDDPPPSPSTRQDEHF